MKVILFGASGMVGRGALRELLADPDVTQVLAIGRSATGQRDPKLKELIQQDVSDLEMLEHELAGYDACLFCLGVSAVGLSEPEYKRITYDLTIRGTDHKPRRRNAERGSEPSAGSEYSRDVWYL